MASKPEVTALEVVANQNYYQWSCQRSTCDDGERGGLEMIAAAMEHALNTGHGTRCEHLIVYLFASPRYNWGHPHAG